MRFVIITLFLFLGNIVSSYAAEVINDEETMQTFAEAIREKGFGCDQCTQTQIVKETFKDKTTVTASVVCEGGSKSYNVILRPNGKIIVENTTLN